jgi:hypothetical protein
MDMQFSNEQITRIRDQSMVYQCACPAQVCVAISAIRELHRFQAKCLDRSDTDRAVHTRILEAAEQTHAELERCLVDILRLEGWDMQTLKMPKSLQKRLLEEL